MSEAENLRLFQGRSRRRLEDAPEQRATYHEPRTTSHVILRIGRYVNGLDEPQFIADDKTQDAVIRNLEIIGEASNKIASRFPEFTAQQFTMATLLASSNGTHL